MKYITIKDKQLFIRPHLTTDFIGAEKNIVTETNPEPVAVFPKSIIWGVVILCFLPIILNLLGVDFSSISVPVTADGFGGGSVSSDVLFRAMSGSLHHALLEWSAVVVAALTLLLAFVGYRVTRDISIPIMGLALLCCGLMDAFHTLAATRLIEANAHNTDFMPFTWALSRDFKAEISRRPGPAGGR